MYSSQHGFRKEHSTQHAILDIANDIQTNMNQWLLSSGVFIDLKKAFETVDHADWQDHAIPLFLEANVFQITFLYYESVSSLMHDINDDKALENMLNLFQKTSNIHLYNARSSTSGKFYVKSSRLEIQNNSFSRLGVKLWNKIPSYITDLRKKAFKRVLRKLLFDILEKEDNYFQDPMIN